MIAIVESRPPIVPLRTACQSLGLNRSTLYARRHAIRRVNIAEKTERTFVTSRRALSAGERQHVAEILNSERFADQPPSQVYHHLLQEGTYLCSISTMHRLLRSQKQNGDRRAQRAPAKQAITRLMATRPNEVWTWDVTKCPCRPEGSISPCTWSWTFSAATSWRGWSPAKKTSPWRSNSFERPVTAIRSKA